MPGSGGGLRPVFAFRPSVGLGENSLPLQQKSRILNIFIYVHAYLMVPFFMNQPLPDYDHINDALQGLSSQFDAAEFHGQLCGLLCTHDRLQLPDWLALSLPEHDTAALSAVNHELFQALLGYSQAGLTSEDFGFQLLLPDDTVGLGARVDALGNWCQGFLLGISHAGVSDIQTLPGELPEIVKDFLNISQAESFELADEEEDEAAYTELVEYVRVGVQLFHEEMRGQQNVETAPPGTHLH
jgi:uncharacterized protein YgfB (UPF0149 family)